MFADASLRCHAAGVPLSCHAHALRRTFAVVMLEQLQCGHIDAMAGLSAEWRVHYTRISGEPLEWVRRRLGHASLTSTMIYHMNFCGAGDEHTDGPGSGWLGMPPAAAERPRPLRCWARALTECHRDLPRLFR